MKKLIWKFRYARHWNKATKMGFRYSWYLAKIHCEEFHLEDFDEFIPEDAADDEMSYWCD